MGTHTDERPNARTREQRMGSEIADGKGMEWINRVAPVVKRGQKV
jgi:hypothetical protein